MTNVDSIKKFICDGTDPITVFYTSETNGGGITFGQDYVPMIKRKYPGRKFSKVFEWCSGPGFIGFALLSHNICNSLCLNDIHDPALELANTTKMHPDNNCADRVSIYLLKDLRLLPADEQFDLVVSNPPHYNKKISKKANDNRMYTDVNWEAHKNFFNNIKSHLTPDGVILLQESYRGSTPDDFKEMINHAGLQITNCFNSDDKIRYFLEVKSK